MTLIVSVSASPVVWGATTDVGVVRVRDDHPTSCASPPRAFAEDVLGGLATLEPKFAAGVSTARELVRGVLAVGDGDAMRVIVGGSSRACGSTYVVVENFEFRRASTLAMDASRGATPSVALIDEDEELASRVGFRPLLDARSALEDVDAFEFVSIISLRYRLLFSLHFYNGLSRQIRQ